MRAHEFISESIDAEQVLKYVKSIHHDFRIDNIILDHPHWQLTRIPINKIHVPDPEGEDLDDPYNRVHMIDMYHIEDITPRDIERNPIVVDTDGYIIDGNHRALAARLSGMKDIPAYVPVELAEAVHPDVTSKKYFIEPTENVRMGDFEFNARTFTGGLGNPNARGLQIRAYDPKQPKGQNLIGSADFIVKSDRKGNQWLESDDTDVKDEYRGKGVAAMMYAFAKSLGNDIKPSPYQSQKGREMWSKWGKDAEHLVKENFADGKVKGKSRPGRVKRAGASCAGSVTDLRAKAKKYGGEKGKMYHWCANMKSGKK